VAPALFVAPFCFKRPDVQSVLLIRTTVVDEWR